MQTFAKLLFSLNYTSGFYYFSLYFKWNFMHYLTFYLLYNMFLYEEHWVKTVCIVVHK